MNKNFHYSQSYSLRKRKKIYPLHRLIHLFTQTTSTAFIFLIYISKGATMKVTFQTQDLCRALERVQRAAQTKVTSNTNNGFFISAEDGKVEFQANDYSIGIRTFCEADVEERGSVLISAPHLLSTIK